MFLKYANSNTPVYLPFNKTNANFSDATPVGADYAIVSSTVSGGKGGYDLYIADINTGDIWSLDVYNNTLNSSHEDLGAHYWQDQSLSTKLINSAVAHMTVFPNPIEKGADLNVSGLDNINSSIEVSTLQGRLLQSVTTDNPSSFKLKMDYPTGIYLVKIVQKGKVFIEKVVVK